MSPGEEMALKGLPAELVPPGDDGARPARCAGARRRPVRGQTREALAEAMRRLAARPGPIVRLQALTPERLAAGEDYDLAALTEEVAIATNTAAAGGNASLMAIG